MMQQKSQSNSHAMDGSTAAGRFLAELFKQLKANLAPEDLEYEHLLKVISLLEKNPGKPTTVAPEALNKEAAPLWEQALENASGTEAQAIVSHLHQLNPFISWIKAPHYREHGLLDADTETDTNSYTCFEVVGPHGFFSHDKVTIGVFLMGPDFYYPSHIHPDAECIAAFSGRGTWHLDNGPIISIPAGARIFIPPNTGHTFWSMERPFAAVYICLKQ